MHTQLRSALTPLLVATFLPLLALSCGGDEAAQPATTPTDGDDVTPDAPADAPDDGTASDADPADTAEDEDDARVDAPDDDAASDADPADTAGDDAATPDAAADVLDEPDAPTPLGVWWCQQSDWTAETTHRSMPGPTVFECGSFRCGDLSHTQPTSWVDIVGGLSDSCEDHSTSFFGPLDGEWDGCSAEGSLQESTGPQPIVGLDQRDAFWPGFWREQDAPLPHGALGPLFDGHSELVTNPFITVYDLDFCAFKQLIGTVYWGDVTVTSTRLDGDPDHPTAGSVARWSIQGAADVRCSEPENDCTSPVCADLRVSATLTCTWEAAP